MLPMMDANSDDPIVVSVFNRLKRRWGSVLHLYRVLAWSPELLRAWAPFAWSLRFELAASRKLRELLIVQIAALLGADYEYRHHLHLAQDAGLSDAQLSALPEWRASDRFDEQESLVLALADELALTPGATAETMRRLRATFSERHCVELLVTGAFYCGVARVINSAQVTLEPDWAEIGPRED